MTTLRTIPVLLSTLLLASCATAPSPNDSASRALNEMKAVAKPLPPKPDPKDARIAELERQKAALEAELAQVRSSSPAIWTRQKPEPVRSNHNSASATRN